ncbi:glycosyltransferase family 2 protein, partial [uncultured Methanobrevibacter sp.]
MTKVSIIMPVFNDADRLDKSINTVINQTLKDIELICVNDGSTDDSLEILNEFAKEHEFIKVLSQENQGSGKARNYGMSEATG